MPFDCSRLSLSCFLSDATSLAADCAPSFIPSVNPCERPNSVPSSNPLVFLQQAGRRAMDYLMTAGLNNNFRGVGPAVGCANFQLLERGLLHFLCVVKNFCQNFCQKLEIKMWISKPIQGVYFQRTFHRRLKQVQVYLPACSCLTPAPKKWQQGDSGYLHDPCLN